MMRKHEMAGLFLIGTATLCGCTCKNMKSDGSMSTESSVVNVALTYLKETAPDWFAEVRNLPPVVVDMGERWKVSFELPPRSIGGVPEVTIEKTSLRVTAVIHTQ